jgi:hypothetical protein
MMASRRFRTASLRAWTIAKAWTIAATALALALVWALAVPAPAKANTIVVRSVAETDAIFCTLPDAITAHNKAEKTGNCSAGSGGDDTIELRPPPLSPDVFLNSELPHIERGHVTFATPADLGVTIHGGYFTVDKDATLEITEKVSDSAGLVGEYTKNRSLFNVDGTLNIHVTNGNFSDHGGAANAHPGDLGGAIFNGPTGTVIIGGGTRFTGNTAKQKGGVIYNNEGAVKIDLHTDEIDQINDNDATSGQGGVIYSNGGTLTISGIRMRNNRANDGPCIFAANHADVSLSNTICEKSNGSAFGHGGGLTAESSRIIISKSTFSGNHEGDQNNPAGFGLGGAFYIDENSSLSLSDSTCSDNTAVAGGCVWSNSTDHITFGSVTCTGNHARVGGCAELNSSRAAATLLIYNSKLTGNKALAAGSEVGLGGALAVRGSTLALGNSSDVSDNSAGEGGNGNGGAIFGDAGSTVELAGDVICSGNVALNGAGGCIAAQGTATIRELTCSNNRAFQGGCINLSDNASLTITQSKLNGNYFNQDGTGGGISLGSHDAVTIETTQIIGNLSVASEQGKSSGGGIYAPSHDEISLRRSTIAGNTANTVGAGIELERFGSLLAVNDTFADQGPFDAPSHGIHGDTSAMNFVSCTFWKAPLLAENGTTQSHLRNTVLFESGHCIGNFAPSTDKSFNVQFPVPLSGCTKTIPVIDPKLDPAGLKSANGGPTPTVAALPDKDSPIIDQIPLMFCTEPDGTTRLTVDQRGEPRPYPKGPELCDIGAYEYQGVKP